MESYLLFSTGTHSFLIPIGSVRKIISWTTPKPLPFVPDYIQGIIHHEGTIWVVIDLDTILGQSREESHGELILVTHQDDHLAFKVRHTRDILQVDPAQREMRGLPNLPEACVDFATVREGDLCYCLNLGEFIREFRLK